MRGKECHANVIPKPVYHTKRDYYTKNKKFPLQRYFYTHTLQSPLQQNHSVDNLTTVHPLIGPPHPPLSLQEGGSDSISRGARLLKVSECKQRCQGEVRGPPCGPDLRKVAGPGAARVLGNGPRTFLLASAVLMEGN